MRPLFKTLAELRESLAVSLGFGAMAGVIDLQIPILNQFLQQAQQQLWRDVRWRYLLKQHIEALGVGQRVLDVPDDAPIGVMFGVYALYQDNWYAVKAGLPRVGEPDGGYPLWYELTAREQGVMQLEFEPVPVSTHSRPKAAGLSIAATSAGFRPNCSALSIRYCL